MEEKKVTKISLSTFIFILAVIAIIVMGIFIYIFYNNDKTETNSISETVNSNSSNINTTVTNNTTNTTQSTNNDVTYTISTRDEIYATIKATKDGNTVAKEFEMEGTIDKTGTMEIKEIGKVALVSYSGGEACIVNVYQLINDKIKLIGNIDCGADMVKEATYTVDTKNEETVVIKAKRNSETITKEFKMSAEIANTSVVDILDYGKVVLVAETGGEYYGIQAYRLSQDYTTGKTTGIINVGTIQYDN